MRREGRGKEGRKEEQKGGRKLMKLMEEGVRQMHLHSKTASFLGPSWNVDR